jgi:phytoene dehydrogenase-like protein
VNRREFLKAGIAGTLLVSCGGARSVQGSIVGGSHERGHQLRGGSIPQPSRTIETTVAILGGGIAGLSAAWRLAKSGVEDFLVFELEPGAGGNSRYGASSVTAYPWGAHYVPLPNPESTEVRELLAELGVITGFDAAGRPLYDERYLCHAPQERLFIHGRWQEGLFPSSGASAFDLAQARAFGERMNRFRESGRFKIPVAGSTLDPDLDSISMADWMAREGFTSERLRWFVDYGMRDDYGCGAASTSAWAGIHYYASRVEDQEVLTWPEGNGWIVRRLEERLGERVRCGWLVSSVREEGGGVVSHVSSGDETVRVKSKRAVYAMPRFTARYVMGAEAAPIGYGPWMTANLHVDRVPEGPGAAPAWDNVIYRSDSLGYVTATHQLLRQSVGPSVLTYYRPMTGDPAAERQAMLARPWESWVETIFADLETAHPEIRSIVSRVDVMLFGHAMARPTPGFLKARPPARQGPILFAHSDMSGLSLFEEAQYHGVRAAEEIARDLR